MIPAAVQPVKLDRELQRLRRLHARVERLRTTLLDAEAEHAESLAQVAAAQRPSARNLIHYLALRRVDLRRLQRELSEHGLSSLGRCEAHVQASVEQVAVALASLARIEAPGPSHSPPVDHRSGPRRLAHHADALLGPTPRHRSARIMVTLPTEAASDAQLVERLFDSGMDLVRINCAHDGVDTWSAMIARVREEARRRARTCPILMDLAGPKLRTGAIVPGAQVVVWSPHRDRRGRVQQPARVVLSEAGCPPPAGDWDAAVPVARRLIAEGRAGDAILLTDARGKRRRLAVVAGDGRALVAEAVATAYVEPGTVLRLSRLGRTLFEVVLGELPPLEEPLLLAPGDTLLVTASQKPGRPARRAPDGQVIEPASIPCTSPAILAEVHPGERIWFDDGKLGGVVRIAHPEQLTVEITQARVGGTRLRSDKGINLPDSDLTLDCLTDKDRQDLRFARRHADLIGLSFVRQARDVEVLRRALGRGRRQPGIVLKIETPQAFAALADILLSGLSAGPLGVMVARGDLAVEVGFARLAEVQEEILWLCEAAHLPVIWGTQVLESLAKKGMATRAEVTDAAMSVRAECVMLNKGPHIAEAVRFLDDVLARMRAHQAKKQTLLRRLAVSGGRMGA